MLHPRCYAEPVATSDVELKLYQALRACSPTEPGRAGVPAALASFGSCIDRAIVGNSARYGGVRPKGWTGLGGSVDRSPSGCLRVDALDRLLEHVDEVEVDYPGDYATLNSYHPDDGTSANKTKHFSNFP